MTQPQLAIEYAIVPESVGAVRGISEKNKILPVARFRRDKFFLKGCSPSHIPLLFLGIFQVVF